MKQTTTPCADPARANFLLRRRKPSSTGNPPAVPKPYSYFIHPRGVNPMKGNRETDPLITAISGQPPNKSARTLLLRHIRVTTRIIP